MMCNCFSTFSKSDAGITILLPIIVILSVITILSLNYLYGSRSFCTSALINGQPKIFSDRVIRYFSSVVADLTLSAIMQSGMAMHDPMVFIVRLISQSIAISCGLGS